MDNSRQHYSRIKIILFSILLLNWVVALAKILYGIISRCSSMTADGFHSFSDGASNIVGFVGIIIASQPKDINHPYGHKKYETLFSLGIAATLFLVCFNLIKAGLQRFLQPVYPAIDTGSFLIMLVTLGINLWVMNYETKKGKLLNSDILVSDALHTKADIFTSFSVIFALVAIKLGYPVLDPIVTILISLFIAHSAFSIIRQSSRVLCDEATNIDPRIISSMVLEIKGVKTCHKIRSRGRPDDIHIDLHVQVSPHMHIEEAHKISYAIENTIKQRIPGVTDVLVHLEPKDKHTK